MANHSKNDLASLRSEYENAGIDVADAEKCPIVQFQAWIDQAIEANVYEPNAMTLGAVDSDGWPSSRVVLLKGLDERGFVFYTNYESDKAKSLESTGRATLTFLWGDLHRQVRVVGEVSRTEESLSDQYFASRPRGSQIGAWASLQSREVASRADLERTWSEYEAKFEGSDVPRPPHWGGFRIAPLRIEFWQGRRNRMHDRIVYSRDSAAAESWRICRLQP